MKAALLAILLALPARMAYGADSDICLNSVGFIPSLSKKATIRVSCTNFSIRHKSDESEAFSDVVNGPFANEDTDEQVWIADFSEFSESGTYYLEVPGVGKSCDFSIGANIYDSAFSASMLGMYLLRCGTAVSASYKGDVFSHAACHLDDAYMDYIDGSPDKVDGVGGWHDAGDYNKYTVNAGVTVGLMFKAWEHFKESIERIPLPYSDDENGIPGYLNEIKWELDWLFKMQMSDGRVYHKLSTRNFGGFRMPETETTKRYFTPWGSPATAGFTAMMALGARIFAPYDQQFADRCLAAAQLSYDYLAQHSEHVDPDQSGFNTGGYITTDEDDRLWAAAEMWETTGDARYLEDFEQRADAFEKKFNYEVKWQEVRNIAMATYLFSTREGKDEALVSAIRQSLYDVADSIVDVTNEHGYGRTFGVSYYWGCNGTVAGQALTLECAWRETDDEKYRNTAFEGLSHLLGRNYYSRSYVTGIGHLPPLNPHDRRSGADDIDNPWPGYLIGGPNEEAKGWVDRENSYKTNEIAINWNGALIYAVASVLPKPSSTRAAQRFSTKAEHMAIVRQQQQRYITLKSSNAKLKENVKMFTIRGKLIADRKQRANVGGGVYIVISDGMH